MGDVMDYERNSPQLAAACVHTLLLLVGNVLADPGDEKKRSVRRTAWTAMHAAGSSHHLAKHCVLQAMYATL